MNGNPSDHPLLDLPILDALSSTFRSLLTEAARSSPDDRSGRIKSVKEWHTTLLSLLVSCKKIRSVLLPIVWEKFELKDDEVREWRDLVKWDSLACMKLVFLPGASYNRPPATITHNLIFPSARQLTGLDVSQWPDHPQPHPRSLPSLKMMKINCGFRMNMYLGFNDEKTSAIPSGPAFMAEPPPQRGVVKDLKSVHIIFKADEAALWADKVDEDQTWEDDDDDPDALDEDGEPTQHMVTHRTPRTSGVDMTEWMSQEQFQKIEGTRVLCCHLEVNSGMRDDFALVMGGMDSDVESMDRMPDEWFEELDERLSYYPNLEVFHLHLIYTSTDSSQETYTDTSAFTHYSKNSRNLSSSRLLEISTSISKAIPTFRRMIISVDHVQTTYGADQTTPKQRQAQRYYKNKRRGIGYWEVRFDKDETMDWEYKVYSRVLEDRLPENLEDWVEGMEVGRKLMDDVDVGTAPWGQEDMIR